MKTRSFFAGMSLALVAALSLGSGQAATQDLPPGQAKKVITTADRQAAAARALQDGRAEPADGATRRPRSARRL